MTHTFLDFMLLVKIPSIRLDHKNSIYNEFVVLTYNYKMNTLTGIGTFERYCFQG